ncbi:MAG: hypothetical protein JST84_17845 [Acidobacteria bacterium]|nr:hypothetical protein [Acidobacteriota bacterium]
MSEPHQEQIEEEYFSQPERRQELWAIFDEMAERFFQGEMESQDAQKFAAQLQTKPILRDRAERLFRLYQALPATAQAAHATAKPFTPGLTTTFSQWFTVPALRWGALAACILLLGLGGVFLRSRFQEREHEIAQVQPVNERISPLPTITSAPTAKPAATPPLKPTPTQLPVVGQRANSVGFYILQEDTRASSEAIKLKIAQQTQLVELHFEVQPPLLPSYQGIAVASDGQTFKSFLNLRVKRQKEIPFVTMQLAVAEIPAPDFTVQIKTISAGSDAPPPISQAFHLEKE